MTIAARIVTPHRPIPDSRWSWITSSRAAREGHLLLTNYASILADLRQQMTVLTYNNWLADSVPLLTASTPTFLVVLVRNAYAQEWLTGTLHSVVTRSLRAVGDERLVVCFVPRTIRSAMRPVTAVSAHPHSVLFPLYPHPCRSLHLLHEAGYHNSSPTPFHKGASHEHKTEPHAGAHRLAYHPVPLLAR
jgi:chromosomal replication initiation ATPase DnaA